MDHNEHRNKKNTDLHLQEALPPIPLSIPEPLLKVIEDRIVEKLFNRLAPLLQSVQLDDEILTIEEASTFLKKSKAQIYQWVNNAHHGLGDFPVQKAGKSLRFPKRELIEWMKRNAKKP